MAQLRKFLPSFKSSTISKQTSLKAAIQAITDSSAMMACLTNEAGNLLGILTDSDVRKALLNGADLDDLASNWVNYSPITASETESTEHLEVLAKSEGVREIPLLDAEGRLVDIFVIITYDQRKEEIVCETGQLASKVTLPNAMLLIAGGKGTRLREVVNDRPKPLALVGGQPILQTIIKRAAANGIKRFFVAVNYMADQIIEHLSSEIYQGLEIEVLRETRFLGTAGSISLLPKSLTAPFVVSNADVLTSVNYQKLIEHHLREKADLTCVVRPYKTSIPFGVIEVGDQRILKIKEKPTTSYLVNSGIYALSPDLISKFEADTQVDMPSFIQKLIYDGAKVSPFYMHEYWMDIGRPDDFYKANADFYEHFGKFQLEDDKGNGPQFEVRKPRPSNNT